MESRGKKKFAAEQGTLDGILDQPIRKAQVAAKPPVYTQSKKKLAAKKAQQSQIFIH
jgi:hypothetical protein